MKIAFLTSHITRSTQWNWFSEELNKRNIPHIHIIINDVKPLLYEDLKKINVPVYYLKHSSKLSFLINFFRVVKILKDHKIDLVHSELPYGNLIGQLAAYAAQIKMRVTTCENTVWFADFNSKKQELIDRITYFFSKKVIALTNESYEFIIKHFNMLPKKLHIIHHSVKTSDYMNINENEVDDLRKELNIPKNEFVIGMVARFEFWKGHIYAVEAMRRLVNEFPHVHLYIFGSKGECFDEIMDKIREYNLEKNIIYKGFVANSTTIFKIFDIHLHIPVKLQSETFGINIIEGMISGCTQVLTFSGISSFTARDGKNCIVVPYKSSDAVYNAIRKLILDEDLRKQLGIQAREDALKHFNYSEKVDLHLKLYNELEEELKNEIVHEF